MRSHLGGSGQRERSDTPLSVTRHAGLLQDPGNPVVVSHRLRNSHGRSRFKSATRNAGAGRFDSVASENRLECRHQIPLVRRSLGIAQAILIIHGSTELNRTGGIQDENLRGRSDAQCFRDVSPLVANVRTLDSLVPDPLPHGGLGIG